jgi:hypothetical protein
VAVFPNTVPDKAELWSIDATTAVATKVGTYADPPADIVPREDQGRQTIAAVIDSAGVLYQIGDYDPNHSASAVLRRPLAPDITSVPYTEKNAPANLIDYTVFPPRNVYNRIYASQLISRP